MQEESIKLRAKLLSNYDKRIGHLRNCLNRVQGLPEARQLEEQILFLQVRKNRLENHYKEIDDMRDEAAELREAAQEFRLIIAERDEQRNL